MAAAKGALPTRERTMARHWAREWLCSQRSWRFARTPVMAAREAAP
jgi:hypothetical protein